MRSDFDGAIAVRLHTTAAGRARRQSSLRPRAGNETATDGD